MRSPCGHTQIPVFVFVRGQVAAKPPPLPIDGGESKVYALETCTTRRFKAGRVARSAALGKASIFRNAL